LLPVDRLPAPEAAFANVLRRVHTKQCRTDKASGKSQPALRQYLSVKDLSADRAFSLSAQAEQGGSK
jgi:hypothetical protein